MTNTIREQNNCLLTRRKQVFSATLGDLIPQYDADGNQTLIKTSTSVWSVTYNAENRPVRWECGDIIVTINFECMDRRHCALQENAHLKFTILKQIYQNRFFAY